MTDYCVVVAERARARMFTLETSDAPEMTASPYLFERKAFTNPTRKAADEDIWTDTRRGAHREHQAAQIAGQTTGVPHHNYDEHREDNERQVNREFARDLVAELKKMLSKHGIRNVVLCAEKQMLGMLRPELDRAVTPNVRLEVVAKDLTNLSPHELHKKLAHDGLIPEQKRARSPGQ